MSTPTSQLLEETRREIHPAIVPEEGDAVIQRNHLDPCQGTGLANCPSQQKGARHFWSAGHLVSWRKRTRSVL